MREEQIAKHTPGEWYAVAPSAEAAWYRGQAYWSVSYRNGNTGGILGAQVAQITSLNTGHEEANARLIAAAPDLLAALQAIDERLRACAGPVSAAEAYDSFYQEIVAEAIDKATGEPKT